MWFAGNGEVYSLGRGTFGRLGTGREADEHVPTIDNIYSIQRIRPRKEQE